jgi:hypothetical protein
MSADTTMRTRVPKRHAAVLEVIAISIVAAASIATPVGRNALAWVYLQSTQAVGHCIHFRFLSLDRLDPTCPQCM